MALLPERWIAPPPPFSVCVVELPLKVELLTVSVPAAGSTSVKSMPPPLLLVELPVNVQPVTVSEPCVYPTPPPGAPVLVLLVIAQLDRVVLSGAVDSSGGNSNLGTLGTPGLNRFAGNTAHAGLGQSLFRNTGNPGAVTAENNWWGINAPTTGDAAKNVALTDWFVLSLTATPNTIPTGGTSALAADLSKNNVGASPGILPNVGAITVTWPGPVLGTITGPAATLTSPGTATAGYLAGGAPGAGSASVRVDQQTVTAPITVFTPTTYSPCECRLAA